MDLYSIGEILIDFIPGDQKDSFLRMAGGAPANVAIAAARNGLEVGFCGKVGNDVFGTFLTNTLIENQVKVLCPNLATDATTTMAFVSLENGERSFCFVRSPGADSLLSIADINAEEVESSKIIHANSFSLAKEQVAETVKYVLKLAHEKGRLVSFDVNYRDIVWNGDKQAAAEKICEILPFVDLLKVSEDEIDLIGGYDQIAALMKTYHISILVLTLGERGAQCFWNDKMITVPAYKGNQVDTTGAGDAFWGGFLSKLISDMYEPADVWTETLLRQAMRYGAVAGGLCVQKKGAISALPTKREIESYL